MSERDLPSEFLIGSATAAHQVEGGNTNNDWWAWEHRPDTPVREPSGDAIDHYHRYREDIALLGELGHNAHRFSLEWSRIEPADGEWSHAALGHYRRVLLALHAQGITPFITLQHFTLPRWLADRGGWLARDAVNRFARYTDRVVATLGDLLPWIGTINEPSATTLYGYEQGIFPPGLTDTKAAERAASQLVAGHAAAVEAVRAHRPDTRVGICLAMAAMHAARPDDACEAARARLQRSLIDVYLEDIVGDFVGVQYYTRWRIDPRFPDDRAPVPRGTVTTQMGWEVYPEGLREVIGTAATAGLPVVVTENGIATDDDAQRLSFIRDHLKQVVAARRDGVDVRGFFYWSAFDNFEWNDGYRPRFGLVAVEQPDGQRRPRGSAHAFARFARSGRLHDLDARDER